MLYTGDAGGSFVPIEANQVSSSVAPFKRPYGWADSLYPYLRSTQMYQCPGEATTEPGVDAVQNGFTDYWMNANLSRAELKNIDSPAQSILCGDGNDGFEGTSARYNHNFLPREWLGDENSPANRHLNVMNILFADGHVRSLKASRIVTGALHHDEAATFALKGRE